MATVCSARASCKKQSGMLVLTDALLLWTQDGKSVPAVRVPLSSASSLFCSKEGTPQVRLKLGLAGDDNGHNFTFLSTPQAVAYTERDRFKKELTAIISRNRATSETTRASLSASVPAAVHPSPAASASTSRVAVSNAASPGLPSLSRAHSVSSDPRGTPIADPSGDFRLRKKVLMTNPDLAILHRDLVISGQITEVDFWDGREHLLYAQAMHDAQRKGKPGQLVDPRPESVDGEIKIRITPQLVLDIFDEYPVVARAYSENVPKKLSEEEFWRRYFQSKLFNAHRASIRSSAAQHVVKDDPILDKYLEDEDDKSEPRRQRSERVELFVDLGATLEDHGETGNQKDVTMQAGRQKGALPLIRKFNEHSERLLNSALGELPSSKRRRLDSPEAIMSEIDLDDLHNYEAAPGIVLEMQDRQRYFEGRTIDSAITENEMEEGKGVGVTLPEALQEARTSLSSWEANLAQLRMERKGGDAALLGMTQNVSARLDLRSRKYELPDGLFRQMTTCQTAANEFLRQFWAAIFPPPADLSTSVLPSNTTGSIPTSTLSLMTGSHATPAQRAIKTAKMATYISRTPEKVRALVEAARSSGIDHARVEAAMRPVLGAVERALTFYRERNKKSGAARG